MCSADLMMGLTLNLGVSKLTANLFYIPKPLTGFLYSNNQRPRLLPGTLFFIIFGCVVFLFTYSAIHLQ